MSKRRFPQKLYEIAEVCGIGNKIIIENVKVLLDVLLKEVDHV